MSDTNPGKWLALAVCACAFGLIGLRLSAPDKPTQSSAGEMMSRVEGRLANLVQPFLEATDYRIVANPRNSGDLTLVVQTGSKAAEDMEGLKARLLPLLATATGRAEDTITFRIETAPFEDTQAIGELHSLAEWGLLGLIALGGLGLVLLNGKSPLAQASRSSAPDTSIAPEDDDTSAATAAIQIETWLSETRTG